MLNKLCSRKLSNMLRYLLVSIFSCLNLASYLYAQEYAVLLLPDSITKNANVVVRNHEETIEIKSPGKAIYKNHYVFTILNEAGSKYADFVSSYDKFISIESITGTLYDAYGKKIKTVKKKDIMDASGNDGSSLITDGRIKHHSFNYETYPYTVEYEEINVFNGLFFLPSWHPVMAPFVSLIKSSYTIEAPADYVVRYKSFNTIEPIISSEKNSKKYSWSIANYPGIKSEIFGANWNHLVPTVLIAPSNFEIDGRAGNMDSWNNLGNFLTTLYTEREKLPDNLKQKIHDIADKLPTERDKVVALYKFMQDNTHYISIQLGLGGWQPLEATYVAEKKYGDCKALSNYMCAILKEAGIKAYPVVIKAGDFIDNIETSFSGNQFNHVIAFAQLKNDSIWLECTSQSNYPGHLGHFTADRDAILLAGKESRIVHTPIESSNINTQHRLIKGTIDLDGTLKAQIKTTYKGNSQDDVHGLAFEATPKEQLEYLQTNLTLSHYDIMELKYEQQINNYIPAITESYNVHAKNYASLTGKRLFIKPNVLARTGLQLPEDEKRTTPIELRNSFTEIDTCKIDIPEGMQAESMPKNVSVTTNFGSYSISYSFSQNSIICIRKLIRNKGSFNNQEYDSLVKFYNTIFKADNATIVLVKKT